MAILPRPWISRVLVMGLLLRRGIQLRLRIRFVVRLKINMTSSPSSNRNVLTFARPPWIPAVPPPVFPLRSKAGGTHTEERYANAPEVPVITPEAMEKIASQAEGLPVFTSSRGKLHFLVTEPEHVRMVLIDKATSFVKGDQEVALSAAIGWGLISEEGEAHRKHQT
jgi:hypothetical protein